VNAVCEDALFYKSVSTFQKHLLPPSLNVGIFLPEYTASSHKTVVFEYSNYLYTSTERV